MSAHDPHISADALPIDALGLDEFETGLLAVLRHFLTSFSTPESQAWQSAYGIATQRWGMARGPQIAQGLLTVIHAMRQAREADFHFANPLCLSCRALATSEEAAFCTMLQAMRRDRADLARAAVLELAEGVMEPALIQAALAFAARFPAETPATDAAQRTPHANAAMRRGAQLRLVH